MPAKNERGIDITSAHGQDTTKKFKDLESHEIQFLENNPPNITREIAHTTTKGVYHFANFEIKFSDFDFLGCLSHCSVPGFVLGDLYMLYHLILIINLCR